MGNMEENQRALKSKLAELEKEVQVPCVDPVIDGCQRIAEQLAG